MDKTVCELFAGVGGFRCGLNAIKTLEDIKKPEKWNTVWFNQWEPAEKNTQYAHDCYVNHFGDRADKNKQYTTNCSIEEVDKSAIPDFNLLVGGFPCQDYSVASSLATSKGLEGKKGVLWWSIREVLEIKKPPFVLLENVDRLIKSPAKQRGRDFGVILACFRDEDYSVEWRVINAADYGYQQRRRRTFIFAFKNDTLYAKRLKDTIRYSTDFSEKSIKKSIAEEPSDEGFFAKSFSVYKASPEKIRIEKLQDKLGEVSDHFSFFFDNSGVMIDGVIYTAKTIPNYHGKQITLGDVMETEAVDEQYFIPESKLYYTDPSITHSDESKTRLPKECRQTWQYIKGAKRLPRTAKNGHKYVFTEGAIPMVDAYDKPARTMLTSEGSFSRTTHIVKDKKTGRIRLLTPTEAERIQGFPTNHTKYYISNKKIKEMPVKKRRFMMGNALVVNLIEQMEKELSRIFEEEPYYQYEQLSFIDDDHLLQTQGATNKKGNDHEIPALEELSEKTNKISERALDSFEVMTLPFIGCDFDTVYKQLSLIIPSEKVSFSFLDLNSAIMCEIICAAICHQMNWDYLRLAVLKKTNQNQGWLSPEYLKSISEDEIEEMFAQYGKPERIRKEERTWIVRDIGEWALSFNDTKSVFLDDDNTLYNRETVRNNLLACAPFSSDPEEKKLQLLLQKLSVLPQLNGLIEYYQPAIDYHLIRLYLRRGLLIPKNKYGKELINNPSMIRKEETVGAIRKLCADLLVSISEFTKLSTNTINLIEWHVGRSICLQDMPDCDLNGDEAQWVKKENMFNKCPFYNTCLAKQHNKKFINVNEPTYEGASY